MNKELKCFAPDSNWIHWSFVRFWLSSALTRCAQSFVLLCTPAVFFYLTNHRCKHCLAYVLTDKNGKGIEQNPNLKMFWWNSHLDKTIVFCLIHLMKDTSGRHCPPHSRKVVGLFPGAWWGLSVKRLHALPVLWVLSSYSGFLPQSRVLWGTMCRCCDWMVVCLFMQPSDKLFSCLGFNCLCPKTTRAILVALPHPASWNKTFINTLLVKIHTFKKKCFWNHSWQP